MRAGAREVARAWLLALGLALLLLPGVLRSDRVFYERDILAFWYPQAATFARAVADGDLRWDPDEGFGRPLLADPTSQVFYPPYWLVLAVGPVAYYKLFVVTHLAGSGLGAWLLLRGRALSPAACLAGGAAWMASGPLLSTVSMTPHFAGACWIPFVLHAYERLLAGPGPGVRLGVVAALQSLTGSADMCVMSALSGLGRLPAALAGPRRVAIARGLAGALGLASLLGACQWIPALDILRSSARASLGAASLAWSAHPGALLDLVFPRLVTDLPMTSALRLTLFEGREPFLSTLYLGSGVVFVAMLGAVLRPRAAAGPLLGLVLFATLALGRHGPLAPVLGLPPLSVLRYPVKFMIPAALQMAVLVALGVEAWRASWAARERSRAQGLCAGVLLAVAGLVGGAQWLASHPAALLSYVEGPPALLIPAFGRLLTAAAVLTVAAILVARRAAAEGPPISLGVLLLAVAGADLLAGTRRANDLAPSEVLAPSPLLPALGSPGQRIQVILGDPVWLNRGLQAVPPGWSRAWTWARGTTEALAPQTAARFGFRGGYDGDVTALGLPAFSQASWAAQGTPGSPASMRMLQLGGIAHLIMCREGGSAPGPVVAQVPSRFPAPLVLTRVPAPLPAAYVARRSIPVSSDADALRILLTEDFHPGRDAVVTGPAPAIELADGGPAPAEVETWRPGRQRVRAAGPGLLVINEAWDAGWQAAVDGRPVPVWQANLVFRGVALPAGAHTIDLVYAPASVEWGLGLTALGLVVLAGWRWLNREAGQR